MSTPEQKVKTDATRALADTKTAIAGLETDATAAEKRVVVNIEATAKTFYERHVTAIAAVGAFGMGALAMLVKLKFLH